MIATETTFSSMVPFLGRRLERAGFERREVPDRWSPHDERSGVSLTSHAWAGPRGTDVRCAYILGPRVEIVNVMGYPRNAHDVPVFAVEYIAFGQKPFVAVADLQPAEGVGDPLTSDVVAMLGPIHLSCTRPLTAGGDLPDWATGHFTPVCVYARPTSAEEVAPLLEAFGRYLEVWVDRFLPRETVTALGLGALQAYQRHHVAHTPGRRFLTRTYGEAWTEAYLREFMYPAG